MTTPMADLYTLPEAPPIPGLRFRPLAGPEDAEKLTAIHAARAGRDGVDPMSTSERLWTREEFAKSLEGMAAAGGADRTILAEIDGEPAGYNRFFDWTEEDGTHVWLVVGWVVPAWRGRGLGTALLHWTERRVRALAAATPGRWEFAANASSTEVEATALLLDNGYTAAYTVLEMGLDWDAFAPVPAAGLAVEIRPGEAAAAARIAASVGESYAGEYAGGRFAERFDPAAYAEGLAGPDADPSLWRVAWAGGEVVGQVIPVIERGRAEIEEVSVRPGWRRGGVARALLSAALLELRGRGVEVVRLHTVAEFPTRAVDMYEKLGFRTLKRFPRYRKPA